MSRLTASVVVVAAAVLSAAGCPKSKSAAAASAEPAHGPTWVEENVDEALLSARKTGKVVFVDGWAPWCHTCLSMQRDVLRDPKLAAFEDRVVFASIDTDRPESASFVSRYPLKSWPTFFIIDPVADIALAEHGGSLSLPELVAFIEQALKARDPASATEPQTKEILAGHAAAAKKDWAGAAAHYAAAAVMPGPPVRVHEAALGAMRTYNAAHEDATCAQFGMKNSGLVLDASAAAGDYASYLVSCASRLADQDKTTALTAAKAMLDKITQSPPAGASVDDKADALATLADVADEMHDEASMKAAHEKRLALLEADANAQKNVEDARVHDYARMNSYLALGRGDEAVKLLTQRTQQLPQSYEAWARLASALHQLKREDEALPAAQKAIELSYGPRRLRYRALLADIHAAKGDHGSEKKDLEALVADADALPPGQKDDAAVAAAKARLAKL